MSKFTQKLVSLSKNKDAKTVASNFMWLSALQVAGHIFPLITMPYLAQVIGVNGFGKIAFASAIMVWIQTVADWGFNMTATRDVAQNRDNSQKVSEIFSNVLWARCLLMFLSLVVLLLLIGFIPKFREEWDVILVTFLMIPGHIFFTDWFLQAIERMKYITILNVLMKFLFTIAVFLFIKQPEDYILQPLFTSLGYVVSGAIALYYIIHKWGVKLYKPNWKGVISTIKGSTDVFINNLAPNLYNSFSIVLLGIFGGGVASGIYDGGNKFAHLGLQVLHTIERAFFPFLSRRIDKHYVFCRINLGISILIALSLYVTAPWLVKIFLSPEFAESVYVLRIRCVSLVFIAISNIYGKNYLIIKHRDKLLRKITLICSVVAFVFAWPLIYNFGYIGTAITVTIGFGLIAFFTWLAAEKIKRFEP